MVPVMNKKSLLNFKWRIFIFVATAGSLLTSLAGLAQRAEISLDLTRPDNHNATGIILITGSDTTLTDSSFTGSATYILKEITAVTLPQGDHILLYPNPTRDEVTLKLPPRLRDVRVEVRSLDGRLVGILPAGEAEKRFFVRPGMLLLTLRGEERVHTLRLAVQGESLLLRVQHGVGGETLTLKSTTTNDDYTITYNDPTNNLEEKTWQTTIPPGTTKTINETINWTNKEYFINGRTSNDATITILDKDGNTLSTITTNKGTIPTTKLEERFNQETGTNINIKITAPNANNININKTTNKNDTITIDTLLQRKYTYTINNAQTGRNITWEELNGKTIKTGTDTTLYQETPQDSTSIKAILEKTGYKNDTILFINAKPGTNTMTAQQVIDTLRNTINYVTNVTSGTAWLVEKGKTDTTTTNIGTDGRASITYEHPATEPNKELDIGAKSNGKIPQTRTITVKDNNNYDEEFNLEDKTYEYWLWDNNSKPEGATIKGWKNGENIITATIDENGAYETNHVNKTSTTINLDSLITTAEGYEKDTKTNYEIIPGGQQQNIQLEELPKTYDFYTIVTNETADSIFNSNNTNNAKIIITTLKDGTTHEYPLNNQRKQHLQLTGHYEPTDTIIITQQGITGYETGRGTIKKNRQRPTASNGQNNNGIQTTIEAIANDTTYYLLLRSDLLQDTTFLEHVAGGREYNYTEYNATTGKEELIMNINGIMQSYHNDGSMADDLTEDEKDAIRRRTQLFNQTFWDRKSGLSILKVNINEKQTRTAGPGNIEIFYWRDNSGVGNMHDQFSGEPNTYDYGLGFVPSGAYLGQFSAETIQATIWIEDANIDGGTSIQDVFTRDDQDNTTITNNTSLIVNMTYKGGTAPKK